MSLAMKSFDTDSGLQKRNSQKVFNAQGGLVWDLMFPCWELLWHKGTAECPENQTKVNVLPKNPCKMFTKKPPDGLEQVVNCRELIQFPS